MQLQNSNKVTTHDIEANGTKYILEWIHSDALIAGYITITEACDDPDDADSEIHLHETYDFKEV